MDAAIAAAEGRSASIASAVADNLETVEETLRTMINHTNSIASVLNESLVQLERGHEASQAAVDGLQEKLGSRTVLTGLPPGKWRAIDASSHTFAGGREFGVGQAVGSQGSRDNVTFYDESGNVAFRWSPEPAAEPRRVSRRLDDITCSKLCLSNPKYRFSSPDVNKTEMEAQGFTVDAYRTGPGSVADVSGLDCEGGFWQYTGGNSAGVLSNELAGLLLLELHPFYLESFFPYSLVKKKSARFSADTQPWNSRGGLNSAPKNDEAECFHP